MKRFKCIGVPRSFLYKPNSNTIMTAVFNSIQSTQKLLDAIKKSIQIHPLLRASLQLDESGVVWLNETEYSTCDIFISNEQENKVVTYFLHSPINPLKDKLCKFILIGDKNNSRSIIVVCHHIICDGISILNLFKDISGLLNNNNPLYNYSVEILSKELLPKPVIGTIGMTYIKKQNAIWKDKAIERSNENYKKVVDIYLNHKVFHISNIIIREDKSSVLFRIAKHNNLSVNSLVVGLILASESQAYPSRHYRNAFSMAINLRPFLKKDVKEQFGYFASGILHRESITLKNFINQIKRLDKRLKRKIHSNYIYKSQALELFHPNFIDAIDMNIYKLRDDTEIKKWIKMTKMGLISTSFVVSNLGKVDWINLNPTYKVILGPYMITDVSEKYIGISTINGELHISMTYNDSVIDSGLINCFKDTFIENIELLIKN